MGIASSSDPPSTAPSDGYSRAPGQDPNEPPQLRASWAVIGVAAVAVTVWHYVIASRLLETGVLDWLEVASADEQARLSPLIWAAASGALWLGAALIGVRLALRAPLSDVGLTRLPPRSDWPTYAALLVAIVALVAVVSRTDGFHRVYPLYRGDGAGRALFLVVYAAHFVGVEAFFRGLLVLPFAARMGALAPAIGALPYVMTHFGKPLAETLVAGIAAVILGRLVISSRSIWGGVVVHVGAALAMELLA